MGNGPVVVWWPADMNGKGRQGFLKHREPSNGRWHHRAEHTFRCGGLNRRSPVRFGLAFASGVRGPDELPLPSV